MAETSVSIPGMLQAFQDVETAKRSLDGQRQQFEVAQSQLRAGLTGEAATIFDGALGRWNQNYQSVLSALTALQNDLNTSIENYQRSNNMNIDTAQAALSQVGQAPAGLPGL
ncbi:WXG100 family type VII secretion target [Lentzea sp. NPDC058436]|uniref:WXG100 family type VII secretion target n=1 Tax=Lentzea sp. NPDC058436 TaxID=3346499 RepID=UPI003665C402